MPVDIDVKQKIEWILRKRFPGETVYVADGYGDNIHVLVVSRQFEGLREKVKQEMLWSAIDESDLTEEEKLRISLIMPYCPSELL